MTKTQLIQILMFISRLEGLARGTHKNEMLPDDMWDEMEAVSQMLIKSIEENK